MDVVPTLGGSFAWCSVCGWACNSNATVPMAQKLCVLHAVARHPALYEETCGRSAEEAAFEYRELLANEEIKAVI